MNAEDTIQARATANKWISDHFPTHRKHITQVSPAYSESEKVWLIGLAARDLDGVPTMLGSLLIDDRWAVIEARDPEKVSADLSRILETREKTGIVAGDQLDGTGYQFVQGDGIEGAAKLKDQSVDLLLTDPPYGISNPYACETQIPRRLRKNGADFIMPRGCFGSWDYDFRPEEWTGIVLPKVKGWAIIFCAQARIGEYSDILERHGFVAVGTMVWRKTNPVPFNHRFKPINAWEALVIGKRPGTRFHGRVVHNVFTCKSPSPQERIHPTQKPLQLIKRFLTLFSDEGDLVLDPFAGSATTVLAAASMGRKIIAYEKDAEFYNLACSRVRKEFGKSAP